MRYSILLAAAAAALTSGGAKAAEPSEVRSFQASRIQVARSCVDYHGVGLQTHAHSGQYGCYTRAGWVTCEQDGQCSGARFDHYDEDAARYARAPGVEGVLSGKTTRLVPRNDR